MKIFKYIFIALILTAFITTGCGPRKGYDIIPINDEDNDRIPDDNEIQDNEKNQYLPCPQDDGPDLYLDCVKNPDCNCNNIPDGEELEIISEGCHSWGCVMDSGWRPYLMIGGALVSGYILGKVLPDHWPFGGDDEDKPDKDLENKDIDYITLDGPPDWETSYFQIEQSGNKAYMILHVDGDCKKESMKESIKCSVDIRNEITSYPTIITNSALGDIIKGPLKYRFNLNESIIKSQDKQYVKIYIETDGEKVIKDPEWVGLKKYDGRGSMGESISQILLKDKTPIGGASFYFDSLGFASSIENIDKYISGDLSAGEVFNTFQLNPNIVALREDDNYLFYGWSRINSSTW